MRNTMKTLTVLASLALIPTAMAETRVGSPIAGTVTTTTYYLSGTFHGAVDISSGRCNQDPVFAPFAGYWNVTIRTTGIVCSGNGSGNQNEAKHLFANGYAFRIWHFIKTADSYDRTCTTTTGCVLGYVGATGNVTSPHVHLQMDNLGTYDTSWYSAYTVKGEYLDVGETVGYL
jgi:murein DD-endopeptidase MepM/ murein hydrolase activator NlpD